MGLLFSKTGLLYTAQETFTGMGDFAYHFL
jgi:hypothetical protein